jgi:hypothetical protein
MMRYKDRVVLVGCVLLAACAGGCPSPVDIASRGYSEFKGASQQVAVICDVSAAELAGHAGIEVDAVVSDIGPLLPPAFPAMVAANLRSNLAGLTGFGVGSPVKMVARITYYQAVGSVETLRGKEKMAVMHVTAIAADGRKLGEFLVIASSDALRVGDVDLAQALARGTARYFQEKLPKR